MYVEMRRINKHFGSYQAAKDISFGVEQGHLAALLGPSGSGKTTILRMIAGLEHQDDGDIIVEGKIINDVPAGDRGIGFVFQSYALFRYMTVYENIAFGLRVKKINKKEIDARVRELIDLVGLDGLEKRYPNELSGGQRQRVAFARALAPSPQLLLLDEPFAAIDAKVRKDLRQWLKGMITKVGVTSIFVTHDQEEAVEVADQIIVVNEGRIEQIGAPGEIYGAPQTPFVAQFIGTSMQVSNLRSFKGFEAVPSEEGAIVRPEFLEAFKGDNEKYRALLPASEKGRIRNIAFRGTSLELTMEVNGNILRLNRSLERRSVEVGEELYVLVHRAYVRDGDGIRMHENELLKDVDVEEI